MDTGGWAKRVGLAVRRGHVMVGRDADRANLIAEGREADGENSEKT